MGAALFTSAALEHIAPSALSLMYPPDEIPGYPREQFIDDLLREHETDIRGCLSRGAHKVQVGSEVLVLYKPLDPAVNLPLPRFLFYSFRTT